jgi:hypothetical protein
MIPYTTQILYKDGFRFRLEEPVRIATGLFGYEGGNSYLHINANGDLVVHAGYGWDGASGPTMDTPGTCRASLVHDALYQLIRLGVLPAEVARKRADVLLQTLMDEDTPRNSGVLGSLKELWNDLRGRYWYRGVRWFGASSTAPTAERKVLRAPRP